MNIEIKGFRSCRGDEGDAYSYALHVEGKRVADVSYDGRGGSVRFVWTDESVKGSLYAVAQPLAIAQAEREEASARAKAGPNAPHPQGMEWGWWPDHLRKNAQSALESHLNGLQEKKNIVASLKRRMKKYICVVREGQAPGECYTVSAAPTQENLTRISAKEAANKGRVLNLIPEADWASALGL